VDNTPGDSDAEYELGGSDTSENANPFTDATGVGGTIGPSETYLYRIDGDMFSPFEDMDLQDEDSGNTYVEMQDLWVRGDNHFDEDPDDVIGELNFLAYTLKFDGPGGDELGIPICTESQSGDYSWCKQTGQGGDLDDATETHRLELGFLGEPWIISEMNNDGCPSDLTGENELRNCGMVKLAKESVSGIINQGESLPVDDLKFQLDDLEAHGDTTAAIISIIDANGNVLEKDKVSPGQTKEFNVGGTQFRFHVYKVAPGYTFGAKWADVAIFSHELELEDGQELDADEDSNPDYEVALGWKNMDATTGAPNADGSDPELPDTLRTIAVFSEDVEDLSTSGEEQLEVGDYVPIVQDPVAWKLWYKGLDLTSDDRYTLEFDLKTGDSKMLSESKGPDVDNDDDSDACEIYAPYIEVNSGDSGSVFEIGRTDAGGVGSLSDNEFYIAVNGLDCVDDDDGVYDYGYADGSVLMRQSSSSEVYGICEYGDTGCGGNDGLSVAYDDIGDGDSQFAPPEGGAIVIQETVDATSGDQVGPEDVPGIGSVLDSAGYALPVADGDFLFGIAEKAGTGSSNEFVDYFIFGLDESGDPDQATFDYDSDDGGGNYVTSDDEEVLYGHAVGDDTFYDGTTVSGPVDGGLELVEEGYISERGSVFESMDDDTVEFDMAHRLARAQWLLAGEGEAAAAGVHVLTLGEGESETVAGIGVKVLEITEDVGACSANGGAATCVADMSGVSAVIMPNNAASVDVAVPYTGGYDNIVMLDSDAAGVNTLVSVGGDVVNTVTAQLLEDSAVDWTAEEKVVKEVVEGSKIVVAGREAEQTLEAAQDFVNQCKRV